MPQPPIEVIHSEDVPGEFIVVFDSFFSLSNRTKFISSAILSPSNWTILPRTHSNLQTSSDFEVIKISENNQNELISSLEKGEHIKYIVKQRKLFGFPHRFLFGTTTNTTANKEQQQPKAFQATEALNAAELWALGITGSGIRVAVFDTGLGKHHPHFRNVKERINWTNEDTLDDLVGHGTFVSGVIASQSECPGFAPDADLHIFRVFNKDRMSYTSWFLDAFNYAITKRMHVLNLSIGGPDFMDRPFVDKVGEMSANGITVVSAIGNDGPVYGTGNNPADMPDVIGVGGLDVTDHVPSFSSRGMTLWELPEGYGRMKPDILTYGDHVEGSNLGSGCKTLSGTSVAAPVASGALTLLASAIPKNERDSKLNPAFLKQILLKGSERLPKSNLFEQGYGRINLLRSYDVLKYMLPHVSAVPDSLDMTDCPYMWPYCSQPLFYGSNPSIVNITVLNSLSVSSIFSGQPRWTSGRNGEVLEVSFDNSKGLWPWSGWISVHIQVHSSGIEFIGTAEGLISFEVAPLIQLPGSWKPQLVSIPVRVSVIPPPPRAKRLLWDQFHSIKYPPGFLPRDIISQQGTTDQFDWNGDHPHTNFKGFYTALRKEGYFIDILGESLLCFDALNYGALLIVDPEDEFSPSEIEKVRKDVDEKGMGLFVISDWYDLDVMDKLRFFDDNTKLWWTPATGGSNIPAINELLQQWGIAFGDEAFEGVVPISEGIPEKFDFLSGNGLARFPADGSVLVAKLSSVKTQKKLHVPYFGALPKPSPHNNGENNNNNNNNNGQIVVLGDSSCLDSSSKSKSNCYSLALKGISFIVGNIKSIKEAFPSAIPPPLGTLVGNIKQLPARPQTGELQRLSNTIGKEIVCKTQRKRWIHSGNFGGMTIVFPEATYIPGAIETTNYNGDEQTTNDDTNNNDNDDDANGNNNNNNNNNKQFGKGNFGQIDGIYIVIYIILTGLGIGFVVFMAIVRRNPTRRRRIHPVVVP